ncbi:hypothetical protein BDN70DRAFT_880632 [Pholiota conissans]|uniref:Uncharacterized protein n=1 Tax=Pholiota conissans TaxID=109636 RepID=A0A9P5Z1C3_9AGAR|nr:hypothetical protein BDN70DRAFT_880632 [Pholiota conissans]
MVYSCMQLQNSSLYSDPLPCSRSRSWLRLLYQYTSALLVAVILQSGLAIHGMARDLLCQSSASIFVATYL